MMLFPRSRIPLPATLALFLAFVAGLPVLARGGSDLLRGVGGTAGKLTFRADHGEGEKNLYVLEGHVTVTQSATTLKADRVTYNQTTGEVTAQGHVTFTDPQARLKAEKAEYNLVTGQGRFFEVEGYLFARAGIGQKPMQTVYPFYFKARSVERIDASDYIVHKGRVTTCMNPSRGWAIGVGSAHVITGDELISHNAVFRLADVPIFYSPLLVNSIAPRPRRSGFLLPTVGSATQKGTIIGEGFFWAINPSLDILLGLQNYSLRGLGQYGQLRADPTRTSSIVANYFAVNDKYSDVSLRAPGESLNVMAEAANLGDGFRGVVNVNYTNSLAFRETFTNNFSEAISSETRLTGFITKNFGADSLNVDVSRYQNFLSNQTIPDNSVIIQHTPSVSLSGVDQEIGRSPLYFSFDASTTGVSRSEPTFSTPGFSERLNFHPKLLLRTRPVLGFHFTPTVGLDATHYGISLDSSSIGAPTIGGPFNRVLGEVGFDLSPPSFEKVFSKPHFGYRFKHVITPDIKYQLVRENNPVATFDETPLFDETDLATETNEIIYSLTNTLMVRRDTTDGSGDTPQARDLISLSLTQAYFFDPRFNGVLEPGIRNVFLPTLDLTGFSFDTGRHLSPIVSVLRLSPSIHYDVGLRADVSPNTGVSDAGITSNLHRGVFGLEATEFFVRRTQILETQPGNPTAPPILTTVPSFNMLRALITYGNQNRRGFSGALGVDNNFTLKLAQQAVAQVSYNFGCFGLDFEFRRFDLGPLRRENQYRVAISLANVGTFGNLKSHERLF